MFDFGSLCYKSLKLLLVINMAKIIGIDLTANLASQYETFRCPKNWIITLVQM